MTTGMLTRPWLTGRDFSAVTFFTILGFVLLINAKNPLTRALRARDGRGRHLVWFVFFAVTGSVLLMPFFKKGFMTFLIFSPLVLSYVVLLSSGKEHDLLTELNGFALLTLSAPVVHFVITGHMSFRLFFAVFIFFASGVFKVRMSVRKTPIFRWIMVIYCALSFSLFPLFLNISPVVLLPLIENIVSVIRMREEKLKTTGNIELVKGLVFTFLLGIFWQ
jgi:hypothetical protein